MYKAPKHYRFAKLPCFEEIRIHNNSDEHQWAYCKSHNFIYDITEQERLLSFGQPCIYTDNRYMTQGWKSNWVNIENRRGDKLLTLKSCIRRVRKIRNLPKGLTVEFSCAWSYFGDIDPTYYFKVKNPKQFNPDYQVNEPVYFNNFTDQSEPLQKLVVLLRSNGFLVAVYDSNPNFLIGDESGGEFAVAHGHGKRIGFSTGNDTFRGYVQGKYNVLWEMEENFDKWSYCNQIPKTTNYEEILNILMK